MNTKGRVLCGSTSGRCGARLAPCVVLLVPFILPLASCGGGRGEPAPRDSGSPEVEAPPVGADAAPQEAGTADVDAGGGVNVPGRHDHELVVEDETRRFTVYVPDRVAGEVAAPVVFMLHGTSQDGAHFYDSGEWRRRADAEGLIVVYPDALTYCYDKDENQDGDFDDPGEREVTTKWNAGIFETPTFRLCDAAALAALSPAKRALADHPPRDDLRFFSAMLETLGREYAIDPRRVYATGFSNGGQMSALLGARMADRFAAAHSTAGFLVVDPAPAVRPVSMALTIGDRDDRFGASAAAPLPLDEALLDIPYVQGIVEDHRLVCGLADEHTYSTAKAGSFTIGRFQYATSTSGADNRLEFAVVEGLFHQYPNGDNHPLDITVQLWAFFKQVHHP